MRFNPGGGANINKMMKEAKKSKPALPKCNKN